MTSTLDRHVRYPGARTWSDDYIALLGYCATSSDERHSSCSKDFASSAGKTRRSEFEALDSENLPWPTSMLAKKNGIPPGTPFVRIWSKPTGLLDLKRLE